MFEEILKEIKKYNRIIIHRHLNPDGDALGSQIGLKNALKDNFPDKEIYAVGDDAKRYSFMEDSKQDEIPDEYYKGALAIILDTSSKNLISDDRYTLAEKTIRLDHHIFVEKIADLEITDTTMESCAGLVTALCMEQNLKMSSLSAKSLFTGIVTDSGRFRYDSVKSNTFKRLAFLLETEFDTQEIYYNLYADELENVKLRASFISKIIKCDNPVAYIYNTQDEIKELNEKGIDNFTISRGMVNTMADIKGIDIWVNFTETETGVLTEIRSSKYNINPIAVKYGGGGHQKASGATLTNKEQAFLMLDDLIKLTEN